MKIIKTSGNSEEVIKAMENGVDPETIEGVTVETLELLEEDDSRVTVIKMNSTDSTAFNEVKEAFENAGKNSMIVTDHSFSIHTLDKYEN